MPCHSISLSAKFQETIFQKMILHGDRIQSSLAVRFTAKSGGTKSKRTEGVFFKEG